MKRLAKVVIPLLLIAGAAYGGVRIYRAENRSSMVQAVQGRVMKLVQPAPDEPEFIPTTAVRRANFGVSLTIVGTLKAAETTPVSAESNGTLIWLVEDGTAVKKGDVLAQLQSNVLVRQIEDKHVEYVNAMQKLEDAKRDRALELENARTQLSKAEQELNILLEQNKSAVAQAEAALEFQRTDLALARAQLGKQQRLSEERLVPRTQVDSFQQDLDSKQFAVEKAEADLVLKKNQLTSDENQKKAEVQRAKFATEVAEKRIKEEVDGAKKNADMLKKQEDDFKEQLVKSIVRAPTDGVVVLERRWESGLRSLRAGDTVAPKQKILELPNLNKMTAACEVEEKDIGAVQRGLNVRITLDPFPDALFHGVVREVATVARQAGSEDSGMESSKTTFTTVIEIREADPARLRPGMNATLEIIGKTLQNVVHVPVDGLFTWKGKPVLYVQRGKTFARTPVRTGARNRDYVVLLDDKKRPCPVRPAQRVALVEPG